MGVLRGAGEPRRRLTTLDLVVGIAGIAILIYLVWRVMGPALPLVAGLFLAYCLFGH